VKIFAAEIAARLQGAHERRRDREDENVSESVWDGPAASSEWEACASLFDQLRDRYLTVIRERDELRSGENPQASAVSAERVVELEHTVAHLQEERTRDAQEFQRRYEEVRNQRHAALDRVDELEQLLATAYVAREVPWSAVAPGMMTIARDGTPWMVERWAGDDAQVVLRNGERAFTKTPADGETVRVLEPYVTPGQAAGLVRDQLGGAPLDTGADAGGA
jgi:hypothetical protein